ncbi:MAG: GNAT family N-acetyltransferase [Anaerolineae bacterium]
MAQRLGDFIQVPRSWPGVMNIEVQYRPESLTYEAFVALNDLCFTNEPVSEYDFQSMKAGDLWCLYSGGVLAGYCHLRIENNKAHIARIAVHPDYRSRGLGGRLMETMIDHSLTNGARAITLSVQQDNPVAISLYRKYGFAVVDESAQFEVDLDDEVPGDALAIPISAYDEGVHGALAQGVAKWKQAHNPPHTHVLLFVREGEVVGFTRFVPAFPGCSPFEVLADVPVGALLSSLAGYALPDKTRIRITTGNAIAREYFRANGYQENYRLYAMARELP